MMKAVDFYQNMQRDTPEDSNLASVLISKSA